MCLGSDNDKAFAESVVAALADTFGIKQVLGSAYHPQAQGAVESPHRVFKTMCRTFCDKYNQWDRVVPIFRWVVNTTTKLFNGSYSPYEVITGMKPRSPIDAILTMPGTVKRVSVDEYVSDLVKYLKEVHELSLIHI